ncbi:hypothetical protein [Streptomyces sp. IBSBF 3136]
MTLPGARTAPSLGRGSVLLLLVNIEHDSIKPPPDMMSNCCRKP